ncbi:tetratricopeptide repeat protein [Aquimarina megaterium]|uniref:tetratricopeptide repeat protein n=1 Tax=Aquimarina megaterium TaxID=1443666 RepID=UPI00094286F0|nr:hypothetical protein [Aquimarina megaterium]
MDNKVPQKSIDDLEVKIKRLEIREKDLKNRTILLTALVPIITIIISVISTYLTINSKYKIDKQDFTQDQITSILKEEPQMNVARRKLKFLIESNLIGESKIHQDKILQSLNRNLVSTSDGIEDFLEGNIFFDKAIKAQDSSKNTTIISSNYKKAISYLSNSLEYDPNNYVARTLIGKSYANLGYILNIPVFHEKAEIEYLKSLEIKPDLSNTILLRVLAIEQISRDTILMCNELKKIKFEDLFTENRNIYITYTELYCDSFVE